MNIGTYPGQPPGLLVRLGLVALVVFGNILTGCSTRALTGGSAPVVVAAPAPVAAPALVVYNAALDPQLARDPEVPNRAVLKAGLPATLTFNLGPQSVNSVLSALPAAPAIVESPVDLPLTVVLDCEFCESQSDPSQGVTFRPAEGRSDSARFQFTPHRRPDGKGYAGKLTVVIMNDQIGREYDRVVVTVAVAGEPSAVLASLKPAVVGAPSPVLDRSSWQADVLLYAMVTTDRNVTLEIQPISAGMTRLLGPLALDAQGKRRIFRSAIDDPELIDAMTQSAYGAMSAVSLQGDLLKKLSATGLDAMVSQDSQDSYMNAPYASLSIYEDAKVKIAPVHSDCECSFWLRSLMGSAGQRLNRLHAL